MRRQQNRRIGPRIGPTLTKLLSKVEPNDPIRMIPSHPGCQQFQFRKGAINISKNYFVPTLPAAVRENEPALIDRTRETAEIEP